VNHHALCVAPVWLLDGVLEEELPVDVVLSVFINE
jgi:hypothetical protein